jgi:hypothetical protein
MVGRATIQQKRLTCNCESQRYLLQMAVTNLRAFVDGVQAGGRLFFSAKEIQSAEGSRAVEAALRRLAKNGSIRRLLPKSPAFVIVPPEHRTMGLPPVEWWLDDLMAYLGQDYYLGLLSAAASAGSSHFPPMETQVVTTKWLRPIETGRLRIRFFQKLAIPQHSVSVSQGMWGPLRISSPALTAFDLVLYPVCSPAQCPRHSGSGFSSTGRELRNWLTRSMSGLVKGPPIWLISSRTRGPARSTLGGTSAST